MLLPYVTIVDAVKCVLDSSEMFVPVEQRKMVWSYEYI